jgi:HEPN domain-containing protein
MGYRAILEANSETVQDLELSAWRRLDEAKVLYAERRFHAAIYVAGLSAEMYLKTACFFVDGAKPGDAAWPRLSRAAPNPRLRHDLWFWCQQLIALRRDYGLARAPNRFLRVIADVYMDWFNEMRYRPGSAGENDAARFIFQVEWLANNHAALRR